jgi:hypothetical protein
MTLYNYFSSIKSIKTKNNIKHQKTKKMPVVDPFPENINTIEDHDESIVERTFAQQVIHEFIQELDINPRHEYNLKEMKTILSDVYKFKKSCIDEKKANKQPRKMTTYNIYVKKRMVDLKKEYPEIPSRDRMSIIAKEWMTFSPQEKEKFC